MRSNTTTSTNKAPKASGGKKSASKRAGGGKQKPMKTNSAAGRPQQQGLKVVHISNPMRVEVTPAEFRSLVQELTGRHAVEWPDHPRWRTTALSGFALDNISNDQQVLQPSGAAGAHEEEVDLEDSNSIHQDFDGFGVGQAGISCCFGQDLSYVVSVEEEEFFSSIIYEQ